MMQGNKESKEGRKGMEGRMTLGVVWLNANAVHTVSKAGRKLMRRVVSPDKLMALLSSTKVQSSPRFRVTWREY